MQSRSTGSTVATIPYNTNQTIQYVDDYYVYIKEGAYIKMFEIASGKTVQRLLIGTGYNVSHSTLNGSSQLDVYLKSVTDFKVYRKLYY